MHQRKQWTYKLYYEPVCYIAIALTLLTLQTDGALQTPTSIKGYAHVDHPIAIVDGLTVHYRLLVVDHLLLLILGQCWP
jgi:hypothetical protein